MLLALKVSILVSQYAIVTDVQRWDEGTISHLPHLFQPAACFVFATFRLPLSGAMDFS